MTDSLHRSAVQMLQWLQRSGLTHIPAVRIPDPPPKERRLTRQSAPGKSETPPATPPPTRRVIARQGDAEIPPALPPLQEVLQPLLDAESPSRESRSTVLETARGLVQQCRRCDKLAAGRTQTVFGIGPIDARYLFIGEAPGADEDREGEPFVGKAGQLLTKIIEACGLRREDVYICNILRCRPPGNRNPTPQEAANCREFLDAQIAAVNPDFIICWGTIAAQNLLGVTDAVGRLRGKLFEHGRAQVLCTYHPSYLLRNPSAKKQVWDDMQIFMQAAGLKKS